jgi:hypothetical protein
MEQSITNTIVNNQITNKDILNSYNYFKNLKSTNPITQIITDYRNEHEEDEDYNENQTQFLQKEFRSKKNLRNFLVKLLSHPDIVNNKQFVSAILADPDITIHKFKSKLKNIIYGSISDSFWSLIRSSLTSTGIFEIRTELHQTIDNIVSSIDCVCGNDIIIELLKQITYTSTRKLPLELNLLISKMK